MTPALKHLKKMKSFKFRDKSYLIKVQDLPSDCYGQCDPPTAKDRAIYIKNQGDKRLLQTLIDEGIHQCIWDLDNMAVEEIQEQLSEFLWKQGYRFKQPEKKEPKKDSKDTPINQEDQVPDQQED